MGRIQPDDQQKEDASATEPGYLFHMQRPPGSPKTAATRWIATGKRKPPSSGHSQDILMSNMRRFILFIGAMSVFFVLAMFVAKKTWQIKQQNSVSAPAEVSASAASLKSSAALSADRANRISAMPGGDADSMRQATLLGARGDALQASGQYKEAVELYSEALAVWPQLSKVRAKMGRTYLRLHNYPAAQAALERAVENTPGEASLLNDLGVAHYRQRRYDRALRLFESAIQVDPSFAPAYYNVGLCQLARGERKRAADAMAKYLDIKPDDARALKERAFLLAASGDYTSAMSSLQAAIKASPDWPPLYFDAAATAALMGQTNDAIMYLEKAKELTSPSAVYLVYRQPAFQDIRVSDTGKMFEDRLADALRNRPVGGDEESPAASYAVEPIVSFP